MSKTSIEISIRTPLAERAFLYAQRFLRRESGGGPRSDAQNRAWPEAITRAIQWLERSALLSRKPLVIDGVRIPVCAVRDVTGYKGEEQAAAAASPVATAQSVALYLALYRLANREEFLLRAVELAHWLTLIQTESGGIPAAWQLSSDETTGSHSAHEAGLVICALLKLNASRPNELWRMAARRAGVWVVNHLQREDGSFAVAEDASGRQLPESPEPDRGEGSRHGIMLLALDALRTAFPESREFHAAHLVTARWILDSQREDGAFAASGEGGSIYSAEHLASALSIAGLKGFWDRFAKAVGFTSELVVASGGWMPRAISSDFAAPAATAETALALRLFACALRLGIGNRSALDRAATLAARNLRRHQHLSGAWAKFPLADHSRVYPIVPTLTATMGLLAWECEGLEGTELLWG